MEPRHSENKLAKKCYSIVACVLRRFLFVLCSLCTITTVLTKAYDGKGIGGSLAQVAPSGCKTEGCPYRSLSVLAHKVSYPRRALPLRRTSQLPGQAGYPTGRLYVPADTG